jgi:hypothetical protein
MKMFTAVIAAVVSLFMSAATVFCISASSYAGKITDYECIMKTEYASHQGTVTSLGRTGDCFAVSGRRIRLAKVNCQGSAQATAVHDESGKVADSGRLDAGGRVYVFGGGRRDNGIAARDIFLLKGKLS